MKHHPNKMGNVIGVNIGGVMVKRFALFTIVSVFLTASVGLAQTDIHYSIGFKYQYASWEYKDIYTYDESGDSSEFGSEMGHLYGPTASIGYEKFGVSISYLMGSWEYEKLTDYILYYDPGIGFYWVEDEVTLTTDRNDLVLTISYRVVPRVSLFVGYKYLTLKHEVTYQEHSQFDGESEYKGSGYGGGAAGSFPLTPKIQAYGTLGYMTVGGDFDGQNNLIVEGGLRMYFGTSPIFGSLGYRYESFDGSDEVNDSVLHGPILTIAFYR
jgi:hypothetical protein